MDNRHYYLLNLPIVFELSSGELIKIKTPSIEEYQDNHDYFKLTSIFNVSILEVQLEPEKFNMIANNYSELLVGLKRDSDFDSTFNLLEQICGIVVKRDGVFYKDKEITEEDLLEIRMHYMIAAGRIDLSGVGIDQEIEEREKENQARIDSIRGKKGPKDEARQVSYSQIIMLIVAELGMSLQEIKQLNYYALNEFGRLAQLVNQDDIQKIATGNGHYDKYKSVIEHL